MIPKLDVNGVSYSYHTREGETLALSDISFSVNPGEFVAVVGPSGCGKSTLLSLISGLISPEKGEIRIDGTPLPEASPAIGYMLQKDHLFEWRTILSNAALGLEIQKRLNAAAKSQVREMLAAYGLRGFESARPSELAGGMRQRAALIRTLALKPDVLLLDEPFSALDYQTRLHAADEVTGIIRSEQKTAILVTHDISEAIACSDRVLVLSKRPAVLKNTYPIQLDGAKTPFQARESADFHCYFNQIWKDLDYHE